MDVGGIPRGQPACAPTHVPSPMNDKGGTNPLRNLLSHIIRFCCSFFLKHGAARNSRSQMKQSCSLWTLGLLPHPPTAFKVHPKHSQTHQSPKGGTQIHPPRRGRSPNESQTVDRYRLFVAYISHVNAISSIFQTCRRIDKAFKEMVVNASRTEVSASGCKTLNHREGQKETKTF